MYSRNYYEEADAGPKLPDNYNGTVFSEEESKSTSPPQPLKKEETPETATAAAKAEEKEKGGFLSFLPRSIPLPGLLGKIGISSLSLPKIGTEEILIIAVAAYLFFSKEGDKECAVMLLLLLLVN